MTRLFCTIPYFSCVFFFAPLKFRWSSKISFLLLKTLSLLTLLFLTIIFIYTVFIFTWCMLFIPFIILTVSYLFSLAFWFNKGCCKVFISYWRIAFFLSFFNFTLIGFPSPTRGVWTDSMFGQTVSELLVN